MTRKAQGLSINALILIALGVLVLVLSGLIYFNYTDRADSTLGACENLLGTCVTGTCPSGTFENRLGSNCYDNNQVCCTG